MGYTYAFKNAYRLIIPENLVCLSKGGQSNQRIAQNQTGKADSAHHLHLPLPQVEEISLFLCFTFINFSRAVCSPSDLCRFSTTHCIIICMVSTILVGCEHA